MWTGGCLKGCLRVSGLCNTTLASAPSSPALPTVCSLASTQYSRSCTPPVNTAQSVFSGFYLSEVYCETVWPADGLPQYDLHSPVQFYSRQVQVRPPGDCRPCPPSQSWGRGPSRTRTSTCSTTQSVSCSARGTDLGGNV